MKKNKPKFTTGFTLIELMVAVSVFSIVMVICMGSILSVFDANKKSQSLRAVMDNLNSAMEGMTRAIRFGDTYHCGSTGSLSSPQDCPLGDQSLTLFSSSGTQITYKLSGSQIVKTIGGTDYPVTSSNIVIQSLVFRVFGSPPYSGGSDLYQPQVIIVVSGYAGSKPTDKSSFTLETTLSQRKLDFQ